MKKFLTIILSVIMLMTSLTMLNACGGDTEDANSSDTNTITIGVKTTGSEGNSITSIINAYQAKYPDKKVEKVKITSDYDQWMLQGSAAHNLPDIIFTQDDTVAYYASQGVFEPLDSYISKDSVDVSVYYDSMMNIAKPLSDGKMYFIPRDYNKVVCYYNKAIFDEAQVSYPQEGWSWSDFVTTCSNLKTYFDRDASTTKYPVFADLAWKAVYLPIIESYGEKIISNDGQFALKSDSKALAEMKSLVDNGYTSIPATQGGGGGSAYFKAGTVAMIFDVRPNLSNYTSLDFDFVSFPAINDNGTPYIGTGCSGYAINAESKNKDGAWDFLKFMSSEDGQTAFSTSGNCVPVIKSMATSDCWKKITVNNKDLSSLNHNAFTDYSERDLITNYLGNINPSKHKNVYSVVDEFVISIFGSTYKNDLAGCISTYSSRLANAIA